MSETRTKRITISIDAKLFERLERLKRRKERGGLRVSRSELICLLLRKGMSS